MRRRKVIGGLLLAALLLTACGPSSRWEGRYLSRATAPPGPQVQLHLEADGKGRWTAGSETVLLRWETRRQALWLHTAAGAVLVAQADAAGRTLTVTLPGMGVVTFYPTGP